MEVRAQVGVPPEGWAVGRLKVCVLGQSLLSVVPGAPGRGLGPAEPSQDPPQLL